MKELFLSIIAALTTSIAAVDCGGEETCAEHYGEPVTIVCPHNNIECVWQNPTTCVVVDGEIVLEGQTCGGEPVVDCVADRQ